MGKNLNNVSKILYFCTGGCCTRNGAEEIIRETRALLKTENQYQNTHTVKTLCSGQCEHAPVMMVQPDNIWYKEIDEQKGKRIVEEHIIGDKPVHEFMLYNGIEKIDYTKNSESWCKPKLFKWSEKKELGKVQIANMDAWEMNLYPFLKDLFLNHFQDLRFNVPSFNSEYFTLKQAVAVEYDGIQANVKFDQNQLSIIIGLLPESMPDYDQLYSQRINEVMFYKKRNENDEVIERGIRMKNRSGENVLNILFPFNDDLENRKWNHFKKIYLYINNN